MTQPIALSLGEPAGIGPDITLMAWLERKAWALPDFYAIGDADFYAARAQQLGLDVPIRKWAPDEACFDVDAGLAVIDCGVRVTANPGAPDASSAPAAEAAIRIAVRDVQAGRARALVTNPIAKAVMYRSGFAFPGHTEFLAALVAEARGTRPMPVMMLWCEDLAVVPVTIHLSLREAIASLTREAIVSTCRIVARDLQTRFGIARPRLALSGLNPHAGENGALGDEELRIIAPGIAQLQAEGILASGPFSADTMFHPAARQRYDCAVCMVHDQALIPIKTIAFDRAVNVTLGLPFVRTSPDHGTAFDVAGSGRARAQSLGAALRLAARLADATTAAPA